MELEFQVFRTVIKKDITEAEHYAATFIEAGTKFTIHTKCIPDPDPKNLVPFDPDTFTE